jgi:hypothetical protein
MSQRPFEVARFELRERQHKGKLSSSGGGLLWQSFVGASGHELRGHRCTGRSERTRMMTKQAREKEPLQK